jgi:hypothetical protein
MCFLPGESTSMISEGDSILQSKMTIINNNAMNENHLTFVMQEARLKGIKLLGKDFKEIKVNNLIKNEFSIIDKNDAGIIAEAIADKNFGKNIAK